MRSLWEQTNKTFKLIFVGIYDILRWFYFVVEGKFVLRFSVARKENLHGRYILSYT